MGVAAEGMIGSRQKTLDTSQTPGCSSQVSRVYGREATTAPQLVLLWPNDCGLGTISDPFAILARPHKREADHIFYKQTFDPNNTVTGRSKAAANTAAQ